MSFQPLDVKIAGGGVAGLEAIVALRALAGPRVGITLVTPESEFVYRAMSVAEPFGLGTAHRYPLERVAEDFAVELVADQLDWVAPRSERIFLTGGAELGYDALLLATGARARPVWPHVITFGGPHDTKAVVSLLHEIESGSVASVAFVVPVGATWPLPLYELALMCARRARESGRECEIVVATPERDALRVFGREASEHVAAELERAGVGLARSANIEVTPSGDLLRLHEDQDPMRFERVVALPILEGQATRGVPFDDRGFIPIDAHGCVRGLEHVYAAGDGTDFPVKHGGIAAQQADAVAEVIAKRAGAHVDPRPFRPVLHGLLLTGGTTRYLRGSPSLGSEPVSEASETPLWWPASKIAGRYLAPYLAAQFSATGMTRRAPVAQRWSWDKDHLVPVTEWLEDNPFGE